MGAEIEALKQELQTLLTDNKANDGTKKELASILLTLLRFSPIDEVDVIANAEAFKFSDWPVDAIYQSVKHKFLETAPYFSRYSTRRDLSSLDRTYYGKHQSDLKESCERDMKFGESRKQLTEELVKQLQNNTLVPIENSPFSSLPPSSTGTRRAALLMEKIVDWSSAYQSQNKNNDSRLFKTLRKLGVQSTTPMTGRYAWGRKLTNAVFKYSQSIDVNKKNRREFYLTYPGAYNDRVVNRIKYGQSEYSIPDYWYHGAASLSSTWPAIEDLLEKILAMNLQSRSLEALQEFYAATAELVWLIGNSQPMCRGSGTVAEILLAVVHLHHGLNPPILKLEFPQLDVLDISFPWDDYKYIFPNFFESQTLPKRGLQWVVMHDGTIEDQLAKLYDRINNDPVVRAKKIHDYCGKIQGRILHELNQEIARLEKEKKQPPSESDKKRSQVLIELKSDLIKVKVLTARNDALDHYVNKLNEKITSSLQNPDLDKYPGLNKWGIRFCNTLLILTAPLSMPIKYLATDSVFFSTEGKSKEAVQKSQDILQKTIKQKN